MARKNPHSLFIAIAIFSFLLTTLSLAAQNRGEEIVAMVAVIGPLLIGLAAILFITRWWWMESRVGGGI